MPRDDLSPYADSAEEVVRNAVEPGEQVIWAGRPDVETLTAQARGQRGVGGILKALIRPAVLIGAFFLVWAYTSGMDPSTALRLLLLAIQAEGVKGILIALAVPAFIVLVFYLNARKAGEFIERARGLTYGITDRRLLVLVDGEIETELTAEQVKQMKVEDRTEGFQDLILFERPRKRSGGSRKSESLLEREKRHVGFKALADADRIQELVERWREAHLASAERSLEDFLEEEGVPASRPATASDEEPSAHGFQDDGAVRTLEGGLHDLTVRYPEEWRAKVRRRRKPFGTVFLDNLSWGSTKEIDDWNVAKVEGPFQTTVEVHVDALTEPTGTYEEALESTLTRWVTGEVVSSDPDVRRGRFHGWSVTRRHQKGVLAEGGELDRLGFFRTTYLHDGVIQLAFVSHWPGGSDTLEEAVDRVERNVTVRSEGVVPQAPGAVSSTASSAFDFAGGVVGRLVTTARIGLGALIFGLGVWVGYDQTTRAESYQGALAGLAAAAEEGLPTLPADTMVGTHDGRLAYLRGPLQAPTATDPLTGLSVEGWRLERTVELRQWQERVPAEGDPTYTQIWASRLIDSGDFRGGPDGGQPYVNPIRKPWPDEPFLADDLELGAWRLSTYAYGRSERESVPPSTLQDAALRDGWTARGEHLYREDDPGVRVRYVYHPMEGGTHSVIGVPQDGILTLDDELSQAPLLVAGSVSADSIVAAAGATERAVQSAWMIWAWVGLMILLRPAARPFTPFERFNTAPFFRRQLMGAAMSAAVVLLLAFVFY